MQTKLGGGAFRESGHRARQEGAGLEEPLASNRPLSVSLDSKLLGRLLPPRVTRPSSGSSLWCRGGGRDSLDQRFSELVPGPATSASAGNWLEMKILRPLPQIS